MTDYAAQYIHALTGDVNTICDFRAIHDTNHALPGINYRGTIAQLKNHLTALNNNGYGIFIVVNESNGQRVTNENIVAYRAIFADLDKDDATQQLANASNAPIPAAWAVNSSPGKHHVYWKMLRTIPNPFYRETQLKLAALFNGDPVVNDAARVMRLPGFYHRKRDPHLVTCHALPGYSLAPIALLDMHRALAAVPMPASAGGAGERHPLGDPALAAPDVDLLCQALSAIDPNALDRAEWIKITAAFKQAGYTLLPPDILMRLWLEWCARYDGNNAGENVKQWNSIEATASGWPGLLKRSGISANIAFGGHAVAPALPVAIVPAAPMPTILSAMEQSEYFKGCHFVMNMGLIWVPTGDFMTPQKFNGTYGGKLFIYTMDGKTTDEPWKAATRGQQYMVPKVHHTRFLPALPTAAVIKDELNREGVNTYIPPVVKRIKGDPSPFFRHLDLLIPDKRDQEIIITFMACNAQFPGKKIPWAVLIQSVQGAGKTIFKKIMMNAVGAPYVHSPNPKELTEGGGKFNSWIANKIMIIVDEIKVDDKRELLDVLLPMITDERIEIQRKGVDQEMTDNLANWFMFTNWKDALPINNNDRRYAIIFSALQKSSDLLAKGMDGRYYSALYKWIDGDGAAIVTDWLLDYKINDEFNPFTVATRAPVTSSTVEAIAAGRGNIEIAIAEAIEANQPGFRGGWISSIALSNLLKASDLRHPGSKVISIILQNLNYTKIGKNSRAVWQEHIINQPTLYNLDANADIKRYERDQGYL